MQKLREKYKSELKKIIAGNDPSSGNVLEDSIADLRRMNERIIQKRADLRDTARGNQMRQALDAVVNEFRATEAARIKSANNQHDNKFRDGLGAGSVFAGITTAGIAAVCLVAAMQYFGVIDIAFGADAQRRLKLDQQFLTDHAAIPVADSYLKKAVKAVTDMQSQAPAKLEEIAGKQFVSLKEIDPALDKAKPEQLGKYSSIVVRADKTAYKVLMNWRFCTAAKWAKPQLIDPVRGTDGDHCSHFGYWNAAGERF
ncbi:hypothetical protein [Ochrobactrum sp. MYb379]|uniref:hypothetical protein n=1 Tax=Ochrobactrum sp. MYb379 TaxID=2745275 RepID=UPI0030A41818